MKPAIIPYPIHEINILTPVQINANLEEFKNRINEMQEYIKGLELRIDALES